MARRRGPGSGPGRRGRTRVVRTGVLIAIAIGISAASMIGLSARAVVARSSCSSNPVIVNVAVSYDIAPAIDSIARAFDTQHQTVNGRCVQVQVTQGQSSAVAAQIDGQASLHGLSPVDAWIPDSTLWVDLARNYPLGAQVVQTTNVEVARSPILLVTSPAVAKATNLFGAPASWNLILPQPFGGPPVGMGLSVDIPDPTDSAVGLSTLIQISRVLGPGRTGRDGFTKFVYSAETTEDFDSPTALATFVASTGSPFFRMAVTEASEQAVVAYDRAFPHAPLVARYPTGTSTNFGSPELNYPYVLTNSNSDTQQAARAFGQYLTGSYAQGVVRYYGFRSANDVADAFPANSGLSSQPLQIAPLADATAAVTGLQAWQRLGLGSKLLAVIDDSAAMAAPSGVPGVTVEQALTQTAAHGLGLFSESTQIGLWEVPNSDTAKTSYKSLVPVGPLLGEFGVLNRRAQMQEIIATLHPAREPMHLNDAILAAYQQLSASYSPNYANAVVVLTAGIDSPGDMTANALVSKLRRLYNPAKRVEVIIIQFGPAGNLQAERAITKTTGGAAYVIANPTEIGKIFIAAIANRMCTTGCTQP